MSADATDATITPRPDADECENEECDRADKLATVDPDGPHSEQVLCPEHRVDYLREVTGR